MACQEVTEGANDQIITSPSPSLSPASKRIISLDFCADQYVLALIDPEHILALSPDAQKPISYLRHKAKNIPSIKPNAENILGLKPDIIIRSYGGGPRIDAFYEAAGIKVITIGWAGDFDTIKTVTRDTAKALGQAPRGEALIADLTRRQSQLRAMQDKPSQNGKYSQSDGILPSPKASLLYLTPSGTTAGPGSLIDAVITMAGFENFQTQPGWRDLPLERLAHEQPSHIAAAFFDTNSENAWSAMRHPIARAQLGARPVTAIKGSWLSCGAWFAMDAAEALARDKYKRKIEQDTDQDAK